MRAVLIGAGQIAQQHLACLSTLPGVTLAGVCDLSRGLAESAAERFGAAAWYTDHRKMLEEARPDVAHIATPPTSHFALARDALEAGAHAIVEKPLVARHDQVGPLLELARAHGRVLIEDYSALHHPAVQRALELARSGELGEVVDVEASISVDIVSPGGAFVDPGVPHPCLTMPGGAIADFLPHLASVAQAFVGGHRSARAAWLKRDALAPLPHDEFRAVVVAERGTARLGFSAHARPESFRVCVQGTRLRVSADLYDGYLVVNRLGEGPRPIARLRDRFREARDVRKAARANLLGKIRGPGSYAGLWELLARAYEALGAGGAPPVTPRQIVEVNDLVAALTAEENRF